MNLNNVSTVASALAAVIGTGIAVATFALQLRKSRSDQETAAKEMSPPTAGKATDQTGRDFDRANGVVGRRMGRAGAPIWHGKAVISVFLGVAAGLIVLAIASLWPTGAMVSLTSPAPGKDISRTKVFSITGKSSHLGNYTIWLTDYDGGYSVDDEATVEANGTWEATDSNVGNPGQPLPFPLALRVVLADPQCATRMDVTMNSEGDYLTALPGGCTIADAVTVNVTTP